MSRPKRWQPPHPAKDPKPQRDPYQSRARDLDKNVCHWTGCTTQVWALVPHSRLCFHHTDEVVRAVDHYREDNPIHLRRAHQLYEQMVVKAESELAAGERTSIPQALTNGWVYLVQVDDLIKIGYSSQPLKRLRSYPPNAVVLAVYPGTTSMEKALHGQFRFALAKGREWFHDRPEIREHIADVIATHGEPGPEYSNLYRDGHHTRQIVGGKHLVGRRW